MPVRLVVKAPNQQIEDQMVECALDWTVRKLKAHLSEAYPSKPKAEEQKLIYSGQLLHDHLMLKDFLRQYDAEKVHTVHLVCLSADDAPRTAVSDPTQRPSTTANTNVHSSAAPSSSSDGLRHRSATSVQVSSSQLSVGQASSPQFPYAVPNLVGAQPPLDLGAQQMAWMQHIYHQYMNVYLQQYHTRLPVPVTSPTASEVPQPAAAQAPQPPAVVAPPQEQQQQPANPNEVGGDRRPPNIRLNAQGGLMDANDEDEAVGNWDWLDWFYVWCRASVLFSIVYFYSSFNRFVLVMIFAAFMYLFRRRVIQRAANARPRPPVEQPAPPAGNEGEERVENEAEQMQREAREIEELMNRDLDEAEDVRNRRGASLVHIAWTFVATFFQSLLPEQQDAFNVN